MNKTYIIIIIVIIALGGILYFANSKKNMDSINNIEVKDDTSGSVGTNTDTGTVPGVKEFYVAAQNFSFTPNVITVKKGDQVKITFNNATGMHDFVIDEYNIATKKVQAPYQEIVEFTANKAGTFQYYCSVSNHKALGMVGTFTVTE